MIVSFSTRIYLRTGGTAGRQALALRPPTRVSPAGAEPGNECETKQRDDNGSGNSNCRLKER
jgi:hypothetical protein